MANNGFTATADFSEIANVDAIIICVPTPLGVHNEPDLIYIHGTLENIKPHLKENQLLVLESTTYPGTTEEELAPFIEEAGFEIGNNYFLGYSPERENPGNNSYTTQTIPKVVSGHTQKCLELTTILYNQIIDQTVPVSSTRVAEMTKIIENIHRAVNIGLVNELKMVADKMNIDIYEVINAAATKPFGFTPYYPGPGLGGHCIPIDPLYLLWKAKKIGMNTRFIELAGEINSAMPNYVVHKVVEALNTAGKSINGRKILILGISYKKNVDDIRESPSLTIMDILINMDADVQYSDPFLPRIPKTRKYDFNLRSIELISKNIKLFDVVVLLTDHDDFDYKLIEKDAKLIVDTRGRFNHSSKMTKA
jgi:UDP-N-acetyl-D-glucosamine dehydrogenase